MISVFIPCIPKHFENVLNILRAYWRGDVAPDEIVLFLSKSEDVDQGKILELMTLGVRVVCDKNLVEAGPARQKALLYCTGDIIVYQDADDLPMYNRIAAVKELFDRFPSMQVLNHWYVFNRATNKELRIDWHDCRLIDTDEIYNLYFPNKKIEDCKKFLAYGHEYENVHAGAVCIRKDVLNHIKWKSKDELQYAPEPRCKSEDFEFCMEALFYLRASKILMANLYIYKT